MCSLLASCYGCCISRDECLAPSGSNGGSGRGTQGPSCDRRARPWVQVVESLSSGLLGRSLRELLSLLISEAIWFGARAQAPGFCAGIPKCSSTRRSPLQIIVSRILNKNHVSATPLLGVSQYPRRGLTCEARVALGQILDR